MRKTGFWKTDWFLGVVVSVAMLAAGGSDLIRSLERKAYDMGVQASSRTPLDRVAVVAIDDTSIANLGRWPWPRDRLAKMTDLLAGGKAKVIANTVFFFEPQIDPGYHYVTKLLELHQQHPAENAAQQEIGKLLAEGWTVQGCADANGMLLKKENPFYLWIKNELGHRGQHTA